MLADLEKDGASYYGGGAAPLFKFVPAAEKHRDDLWIRPGIV
jgi:hypothetical protein